MERLRHSKDIQQAFQEGARVYSPTVVLHARRRGEGAGLRVGVIASKKVGGAVVRNRARRVLRETARQLSGECLGAWDVLLVARPEIVRQTPAERLGTLRELLRKAGVLEQI